MVSIRRRARVMDVKVLFLLLAAVWRCDARCHNLTLKNAESLMRSVKYDLSGTEDVFEENSPKSCPVRLFPSRREQHKRSLSPWRYIKKTSLEGLYPRTYTEAQCLCSGCIVFDALGDMNHTDRYNSVPVVQSLTFLKKVRCRNNDLYRLELEQVPVSVGCTCLLPQN